MKDKWEIPANDSGEHSLPSEESMEDFHFDSAFDAYWPVYTLGAFVYLFLHLLCSFGLLPFWITWIPIVILSAFAVITWLLKKLKKL